MAEWKSVRISDQLYELAQAASGLACRSLTQQLEYWARLGAALDASGVTAAQVAALHSHDEAARKRVLAQLDVSPAKPERTTTRFDRGDAAIAGKHARIEKQVRQGKRDVSTLLILPRKTVRSAKVKYPPHPFGKPTGW